MPKRPPPPSLSAPKLHLPTADSSTDKKEVIDSPTKMVPEARTAGATSLSSDTDITVNSESPNAGGKKLVNRMKASFRSLTTRRHKNKDE